MYEIILNTWYQEKPDKKYNEAYRDLEFYTITDAVNFLHKNIDAIVGEFPVEGISIKLKHVQKS